ncbi:ubiquitin carboxyl-terminal hydrolase nonstop isoform X1 [Diabrotica virgifera virgifera]|uniref:ubiquitinyl hydrolase 1 n=1 Tax=Diabrotica virgifera virgifera TaxID=50390 RepID=A0A6P7FRP4_DIAVI|nr:ubiquitin carboxyl-terminal hydrolase nonstop isoform X1 [Diabrotica virgifera virgifera]
MTKMSAKGCHHLQVFKKTHAHVDALKWVHVVFVVTDTPKSRKAKICNSYCRTCKKRGPFLHACLECVYFGCHKHIRDHMIYQKHAISMDLSYGQLHCSFCNDYIYDSEIEELTSDNAMNAKVFRKRLFEWNSFDASPDERDLLHHRTKRICITPESTIGLRGLINLGKTCFVNCIVQALIHTPLLRDYFLTERHNCNAVVGACLVCEVSKIFQEFYRGARLPLALHELLHLTWIHATHLAGYKQQDAHEFFIATLNILHKQCLDTMPKTNEMVQKENDKCPCIIDQIFTGGLQSDLVCKRCNGVSTTIDPIWDFSLDLGPVTLGGRQPSSLHECLDRFTRAELLENKEKTFCSNCQSHEESTKQFTMKTLPIVVCFHLKRFQHTNEVKKKISTVISFPEMLDMTPFMSRSKEQTSFPIDNRYSLFAVIIHVGPTIDIGHYVAYVRQQHDFWYKCDDDVITRANLKEVLGSEGYLLFYHKHVLGYE